MNFTSALRHSLRSDDTSPDHSALLKAVSRTVLVQTQKRSHDEILSSMLIDSDFSMLADLPGSDSLKVSPATLYARFLNFGLTMQTTSTVSTNEPDGIGTSAKRLLHTQNETIEHDPEKDHFSTANKTETDYVCFLTIRHLTIISSLLQLGVYDFHKTAEFIGQLRKRLESEGNCYENATEFFSSLRAHCYQTKTSYSMSQTIKEDEMYLGYKRLRNNGTPLRTRNITYRQFICTYDIYQNVVKLLSQTDEGRSIMAHIVTQLYGLRLMFQHRLAFLDAVRSQTAAEEIYVDPIFSLLNQGINTNFPSFSAAWYSLNKEKFFKHGRLDDATARIGFTSRLDFSKDAFTTVSLVVPDKIYEGRFTYATIPANESPVAVEPRIWSYAHIQNEFHRPFGPKGDISFAKPSPNLSSIMFGLNEAQLAFLKTDTDSLPLFNLLPTVLFKVLDSFDPQMRRLADDIFCSPSFYGLIVNSTHDQSLFTSVSLDENKANELGNLATALVSFCASSTDTMFSDIMVGFEKPALRSQAIIHKGDSSRGDHLLRLESYRHSSSLRKLSSPYSNASVIRPNRLKDYDYSRGYVSNDAIPSLNTIGFVELYRNRELLWKSVPFVPFSVRNHLEVCPVASPSTPSTSENGTREFFINTGDPLVTDFANFGLASFVMHEYFKIIGLSFDMFFIGERDLNFYSFGRYSSVYNILPYAGIELPSTATARSSKSAETIVPELSILNTVPVIDRLTSNDTTITPLTFETASNSTLMKIHKDSVLPLYFDFDSAALPLDSASTQSLLDFLSAKVSASNQIILRGYCSPEGDNAYNIALAQDRCDSVKRFIEEKFPNLEIITVPVGEIESSDGVDSAILRRVDIIVPSTDSSSALDVILDGAPLDSDDLAALLADPSRRRTILRIPFLKLDDSNSRRLVLRSMFHGGVISPIQDYTPIVTSDFGERWGTLHPGVDISSTRGESEPLYAPISGIAQFIEGTEGYGNYILLWPESKSPYSILLGHCSQKNFSNRVVNVRRGDFLCYMGSTGASTGFHVHMEMRVGLLPLHFNYQDLISLKNSI